MLLLFGFVASTWAVHRAERCLRTKFLLSCCGRQQEEGQWAAAAATAPCSGMRSNGSSRSSTALCRRQRRRSWRGPCRTTLISSSALPCLPSVSCQEAVLLLSHCERLPAHLPACLPLLSDGAFHLRGCSSHFSSCLTIPTLLLNTQVPQYWPVCCLLESASERWREAECGGKLGGRLAAH